MQTKRKGGGTLPGRRPRFAIEPLVGEVLLACRDRQLVADGLLHLADLGEGGVRAAVGVAVEESCAVVVDLKPAVAHGCEGDGQLTAKFAEELGRYPSGLGQIASGNAVSDLSLLVFSSMASPPRVVLLLRGRAICPRPA